MSFDLNAFRQAKCERRQEKVSLPSLAQFFADGEEPEFTLQMLTSEELHRSDNSIQAAPAVMEFLKRISSSNDKDKAEMAAEALGIIADDDVPATLKKQLEIVRFGVANPQLDLQDAVKIAAFYPVTFRHIWRSIAALTDQEAVVAMVKRHPSGKGKTSETP